MTFAREILELHRPSRASKSRPQIDSKITRRRLFLSLSLSPPPPSLQVTSASRRRALAARSRRTRRAPPSRAAAARAAAPSPLPSPAPDGASIHPAAVGAVVADVRAALGLVPRRAAVELAPRRRCALRPCARHTSSKPRGIRDASTAAYAPSTSAPAPATTIERIGTAARFAPCARSAATTSCAADESATSSGVSPQPPRFCGSAPAASSARAPTARLFDAIRWSGVIVRVERLDVAAARDEERGRALVAAAHAAHA